MSNVAEALASTRIIHLLEEVAGERKLVLESQCQELLRHPRFGPRQLYIFSGHMFSLLGGDADLVTERSAWLVDEHKGYRFSRTRDESELIASVDIVPTWRVTLPFEDHQKHLDEGFEPLVEEKMQFGENGLSLTYRAYRGRNLMFPIQSSVTGEVIPLGIFSEMDGNRRPFKKPWWDKVQATCHRAFKTYQDIAR